MSVSLHGIANVLFLGQGANLAMWSDVQSLSSLPVPGMDTRLIRKSDGSLEVIPKTPAEVMGERIVKPAWDFTCDLSSRSFQVLKGGFALLDTLFANALPLLPGAAAQSVPEQETSSEHTSTYERCMSKALETTYPLVIHGVESKDAKMVEAVHSMYGELITECNVIADYERIRELYNIHLAAYEEAKKRSADVLKACEKTGYTCFKGSDSDGFMPHMFPVEKVMIEKGVRVTRKTWDLSQGCLYWTIYKDCAFPFPNEFYASDDYNYNLTSRKCSVESREDVERRNGFK